MRIRESAAVLLSAVAIAGNVAAQAPAHDAGTSISRAFQMAAVIDRARGDAVLAGNYGRAIEALERSGRKHFASRTNLCIAYTLSGDLAKADAECGAALRLSKDKVEHASDSTRRVARRDVAVALSNLGVVKAVSGDLSGAYQDFTLAVEIDPRMRQADANLQKLRKAYDSDV
jgi:tetratricopeptide (TPR) repeat protein